MNKPETGAQSVPDPVLDQISQQYREERGQVTTDRLESLKAAHKAGVVVILNETPQQAVEHLEDQHVLVVSGEYVDPDPTPLMLAR